MFYMLVNLVKYIMFIIVMVMSCGIVSYIMCIFDVLCEYVLALRLTSLCISVTLVLSLVYIGIGVLITTPSTRL